MDVLPSFDEKKNFLSSVLECRTAITATEPGTRYYGAVIYGVPLRHSLQKSFHNLLTHDDIM